MPFPSTLFLLTRFFDVMEGFKPFEKNPTVAVALSGGADSLALCLLLNQWVIKQEGMLIALTVDHGLRQESTQEAQMVNQWMTKRGIYHHILSWEGKKPFSDVQNQARINRYQLLEKWCKDHHILHLFFAHHADDQEETIVQRLLHGSGPLGLQGMTPCTYRSFGRILRPFLSFSKKELVSYLHKESQDYIQDPSNEDPQFERVGVRSFLPLFHHLTKTPYPFTQSGEKCFHFREGVLSVLTDFFLNAVHLSEFGFLTIDKGSFFDLEASLQSLTLSQSLQAIGGNSYPFSFKKLKKGMDALHNHKNITLGGCFLRMTSSSLFLLRETRAISPDCLVNQTPLWWDHRFLIDVPSSLLGSRIIPQSLHQKPLCFFPHLPSFIQKTLPLLITGDKKIIPIPHPKQGISLKLHLKNRLLPSINSVSKYLNMIGSS